MSVYFITFRSVTLAQRGEGALAGAGLRATLTRTPRWMEEQGCGYSLRFRTDDPAKWVDVLRRRGIAFRRLYRRGDDGVMGEVTV